MTGSRSSDRRLAAVLAQVDVSTPVGVLNYALTLEHLEHAFYRDGLAGLEAADFDDGVFDNLAAIAAHEADHVATLTDTIVQLGGEPVTEVEYDFGEAFADPAAFLATAQALENTGVGAYTGAAQFLIAEDALLTAALTIHGVEARHASYLNRLNGGQSFPDAVDAPLTPEEVMAIATPFFVAASAAPGTGGTGETSGAGAAASSSAGSGSNAGAVRATTAPSTGVGTAYRSGGEGIPEGLPLLGLAGAAAAALLARRRLAARGDERPAP